MVSSPTPPAADPRAGPLLEVRGISKAFPGVQALDRVDLTLVGGEVLAVIGENGAGKSTLMHILAGIHRPDAGQLRLAGRALEIGSPRAASAVGLGMIHQEPSLADNLDVGANIFLGREPARRWRIDKRAIARRAGELLGSIGARFGPDTPTASLSVGQRQQVEIAKALAFEARVLIMDEPTSSLAASEAEVLFQTVRALVRRGVGVIYVSHRLGEVRALADRVLVLRDGRNAGELAGQAVEHGAMVRLMVGDEVARQRGGGARGPRPSGPRPPARPLLEVRSLVTAAHPGMQVDLTVRAGEMVGLAGLVGSGRTELLRAIFGIERPLAGEVRLDGQRIAGGARAAIAARLALVPEDRKGQGLFADWSVAENVALASLERLARAGWVDRRAMQRLASRMIEALGVRLTGPRQAVGLLSGGNQQKVVLAKWLATEPRLLLMDEPTRGIDVGARLEIYALMQRLVEDGVAILFASSEMEEVLSLPDRVLVMHEGRIAGELTREELGEQALMRLATGGGEGYG